MDGDFGRIRQKPACGHESGAEARSQRQGHHPAGSARRPAEALSESECGRIVDIAALFDARAFQTGQQRLRNIETVKPVELPDSLNKRNTSLIIERTRKGQSHITHLP